eukprot:1450647-Alexandrium_andersonii.AAC.1
MSAPSVPLAEDRGVPYFDCDWPVSPAGVLGRSAAAPLASESPAGKLKGATGGSSEESDRAPETGRLAA